MRSWSWHQRVSGTALRLGPWSAAGPGTPVHRRGNKLSPVCVCVCVCMCVCVYRSGVRFSFAVPLGTRGSVSCSVRHIHNGMVCTRTGWGKFEELFLSRSSVSDLWSEICIGGPCFIGHNTTQSACGTFDESLVNCCPVVGFRTSDTPAPYSTQRKFYVDFNTVFVPLLLLAAGVGFPAACF